MYTTHDVVGSGDVELPSDEIHTRAATIVFSDKRIWGHPHLEKKSMNSHLIIESLTYLFRNISPVFLMCDHGDIGVYGKTFDSQFKSPVIYVFDVVPGGVGIAVGFIEKQEVILQACYRAVLSCICEYGCPSCIGPSYGKIPRGGKTAVIDFLFSWIELMNLDSNGFSLDNSSKSNTVY